MGTIMLGTNAVKMDEPCFSLKEIIEQSPGSRGFRRYQVIKVVRADSLAEFRRDLGPATRFKASEFAIPGGVYNPETGRAEIVETVGRLVDIADYLRSDAYDRPPTPQPYDLIKGYQDLPDRRRRRRKKVSSMGPFVRVQRD